MALGNYAQLQAAIGTWAYNRTDLPAADLITLAEDRLNADIKLRVMEVEASLTGTLGSRFIPLPAQFLEPFDMWLEQGWGREPLEYIEPDLIPNWANQVQPVYWTVDGTNVAFEAPCQQAYSFTLRYLQRFQLSSTAPDDGTQTNYLLTNWPSAYLAAANIEAALWLQDDAQASRWEARYQKAQADIAAKEQRSQNMAKMRFDPALQSRLRRFNINRGF